MMQRLYLWFKEKHSLIKKKYKNGIFLNLKPELKLKKFSIKKWQKIFNYLDLKMKIIFICTK